MRFPHPKNFWQHFQPFQTGMPLQARSHPCHYETRQFIKQPKVPVPAHQDYLINLPCGSILHCIFMRCEDINDKQQVLCPTVATEILDTKLLIKSSSKYPLLLTFWAIPIRLNYDFHILYVDLSQGLFYLDLYCNSDMWFPLKFLQAAKQRP